MLYLVIIKMSWVLRTRLLDIMHTVPIRDLTLESLQPAKQNSHVCLYLSSCVHVWCWRWMLRP